MSHMHLNVSNENSLLHAISFFKLASQSDDLLKCRNSKALKNLATCTQYNSDTRASSAVYWLNSSSIALSYSFFIGDCSNLYFNKLHAESELLACFTDLL
jgi:hypothetical protein